MKLTIALELKQIKAASEVAENRLRLEEKLVTPGVTLKAGVNQDPDLTSYRFGLSIPITYYGIKDKDK